MKHKAIPWKVHSTKHLFSHERIRVNEDTVELPNGKLTTYAYLQSKTDSVVIIAINEKNELLLQREYSHPPKEVMWQLPGGSMHIKESVEEAVQRELSEESGYASRALEILGYYFTSNRNTKKKQYVVLCKDLYENKLPEDHDEFIESYWLSLSEVHTMIENKEFNNINLLASLNLLFHSTLD